MSPWKLEAAKLFARGVVRGDQAGATVGRQPHADGALARALAADDEVLVPGRHLFERLGDQESLAQQTVGEVVFRVVAAEIQLADRSLGHARLLRSGGSGYSR
ncbi:hypothetical protein [Amycolatopsis nalaikhensis]|uniref:Uncharacterized protein n=1 Tax=Amycolatopsis nalaikhensis TaxID=715472 RepID=A0ABY8XNK1_9PSEU|nr:hypothetical protein [Amycolatopsis sp. 2-2]WIV57183.1 hypothetical protein QP939_00305 [Amycolatopsis sp. 2-2]